MKKYVTSLAGRAFVASLIACAIDLRLSAANGYFIRADRLALFGFEWLGVAAVVSFALGGMLVASLLFRRRELFLAIPLSTSLAGAWSAIALILLWRHRDAIVIASLGAAAAVILAVAVMEVRTRVSSPAALFGQIAAFVAGTQIGLVLVTDFPGRAMLADQMPASSASSSATPAPNLLFIVMDTMRADHMGTYGYDRPTTPFLDGFAKNATVFERVVASSSYTLPTHATLFTGLFSESHGAIAIGDRDAGISLDELNLQADWAKVLPLSDEATTLAEILQGRGYQTGAMCANSAYLARAFNLDQGFDAYVDATGSNSDWRPLGLSVISRLPLPAYWRFERMLNSSERYYLLASEINELALTWLDDKHDKPFFLFLNYMEPHSPFLPLPGYRDLFPLAYARTFTALGDVNNGTATITDEEIQKNIDAYDAEIRSMDDKIAELFAQLEAWGALENTVVVVVSDHGEAFGEHGKFGHAISLYEEEVHVPLIVRVPDQVAGERVARRVHTVDVVPTLLRLMGVESTVPMEGGDLFNDGRTLPPVAYFGPYERDYSEHSVYDGPLKLILRSDAPPQLYDLTDDPGELKDLADDRPDDVARLLALFDEYRNRPGPRFSVEHAETDAETQERLRSLGYGDR